MNRETPPIDRGFSDGADPSALEAVDAADVPEPYRRLLVHTHHMTVTVEAHYGEPVDVRVLDRQREGDFYTRHIVLTLRSSGRPVQYGFVRLMLPSLSVDVQNDILGEQIPLGRVLIDHGVMRHIQPAGYFRVHPSPQLAGWLGCDVRDVTYGRRGLIFADGRPAVWVLEILSPVDAVSTPTA